MSRLFAALCLVLATFIPASAQEPAPTANGVLLESNFEADDATGPIDHWLRQAPHEDAVQITRDHVRAGAQAVRVQWRRSDWVAGATNTIRAELTLGAHEPHRHFTFGQGYWIGFSEFIPGDWQRDDPENYDVIWQFHGADGGHGNQSPPLAGRVVGDEIQITMRNGRAGNGADFKGRNIVLATLPILKEEWSDWVVNVNFDLDAGFVRIWRNGVLVAEATGSTIYENPHPTSADGPYFKIGDYRPRWGALPSLTDSRTLYLDEIRIADGRGGCADVSIRGAAGCGRL